MRGGVAWGAWLYFGKRNPYGKVAAALLALVLVPWFVALLQGPTGEDRVLQTRILWVTSSVVSGVALGWGTADVAGAQGWSWARWGRAWAWLGLVLLLALPVMAMAGPGQPALGHLAAGGLGLWGLGGLVLGLAQAVALRQHRVWLARLECLLWLLGAVALWPLARGLPAPIGGWVAHAAPYQKHFFPAMRGYLRWSDGAYAAGGMFLVWVTVQSRVLTGIGVRWGIRGLGALAVVGCYGTVLRHDGVTDWAPDCWRPSAATIQAFAASGGARAWHGRLVGAGGDVRLSVVQGYLNALQCDLWEPLDPALRPHWSERLQLLDGVHVVLARKVQGGQAPDWEQPEVVSLVDGAALGVMFEALDRDLLQVFVQERAAVALAQGASGPGQACPSCGWWGYQITAGAREDGRDAWPLRPSAARVLAESPAGPEVLFACAEPTQLSAQLRTDNGTYRLEVAVGSGGRRYVHIKRKGAAHRALPIHKGLGAVSVALPQEERFLVNARSQGVVASWARWQAVRSLGNVPPARLAALGLGSGQEVWRLTLRCGRQVRHWDVGRLLGGRWRYLREPGTHVVRLVAAAPLQALQSAHFLLMEKRWVPPGVERVDRVRIRHGQQWVEVQRAQGVGTVFRFVKGAVGMGTGWRMDGQHFGRWLARVLQLPLQSYVWPETSRGSPGRRLEPALEVKLWAGASRVAELRFATVAQGGDAREQGPRYLGRSGLTGGWVLLGADAAQLLGGDLWQRMGFSADF